MKDDGDWYKKLKDAFGKSSKEQREAKKRNRFGNMGNKGGGSSAYQQAANELEESYEEDKK